MEDRTNVHIKYVEVAGGEATEKYGLMLASGDYPDMLWQAGRSYPGGLSKGVSDGILVDLTEYVEQYMPNYKSWYQIDPEYEKRVLTDERKNIGIYELFCDFGGLTSEPEWNGLAIRQDWLDRLGLSTPVTIEDWTNVLTKFKEEIGCAKPLMVGPTGSILSKAFLSAYGVTDEFYVDGASIKYGPAEPGFKEWLILMADWYKKGLLDPDFVSAASGAMMEDNGEIANGTTGAFPTITPFLGEGMKLTGYEVEDGFYISAVQAPVLNKGDVVQYRTPVQVVNMSHCVVTTNCKDIPLACKWLDYQYTKEGMLFNCLGVEGESYVENADGTYSFTELITNNPDGYSPTDATSIYTRMGAGNLPGLYNFFRDTVTVTEAQREGIDTWMKDGDAMCIPDHMSMTEEEGAAYNFLYTALKTMANEYTVHVITGIESADTFEEFVASLYEHGLEECLGYQQAAYNRLLNR